ncbi:hypothetical protein BDV98DRAFT_571329 [Pterulicium gracile]|uniref:Uncharacterized protein n=1 Tax=Pterulicium gracile TaxID=1884261 RepID=A0A5C3QC17_9AGAR|nr:hypothetical protein BDV98DRAFT_571329 [Pterula gracilis]
MRLSQILISTVLAVPTVLGAAVNARQPNLEFSKRQAPNFLIYACTAPGITGSCQILAEWYYGQCVNLQDPLNNSIVSLVSTFGGATCYLFNDPDCPGNLNEALLLEGLERKSDLTLSNPEHAKQLSSFFCFENGNEVV